MIEGEVDGSLEAKVELLLFHDDKQLRVSFLVDSGFNGYLAIPEAVVRQLNLPLATVQSGSTADGRRGYFDTVDLSFVWMDRVKRIRAQVLEEPLLGTRLLFGHDMQVRWEIGGEFRLTPIPETSV